MPESPAVLVDAALDYLSAVMHGEPLFATTVASNYGPERVSKGMATLLVFLVADAAQHTDTTTGRIIETMRETYAPREADAS